MNILYLSPWYPFPLDTGLRIRVHHLSRSLAQRHSVTLLALDPQGWAPPQFDACASVYDYETVVAKDPFQRGNLHTATRYLSLRPIVTTPIREMMTLVRNLHRQKPFDVAVAATIIMADYTVALSDVVRVLEEHNSHTRWMRERYEGQSGTARKLARWASWRKTALYETRLFKRFDLVTMVSEQDAATTRSLVAKENPPVMVFPNGVDCRQFQLGLVDPQPNRLIFSGALAYDSNLEAMEYFLRQVFPPIRRAAPEAHLRITGSHRGVDLDRLPLSDSVHLTGYVDDVRPEIASAQVAVVPIRSGGGTRIKILEAMALGTPVVSTTKGAEGLKVRHGEHILLADDPETFARHTVELLTNPVLRQQLRYSARRLVEQEYDWNQIGERFVHVIEAAYRARVSSS